MDMLTLELLDVTVFQALLELRALLAEHPGESLRILGEEELLRLNVVGYLEKQGRIVRVTRQGNPWEVQVAPASRPLASVVPAAPPRLPVLLLRVRLRWALRGFPCGLLTYLYKHRSALKRDF